MALFSYIALTEKGKKISGMIDAESLIDAKQKVLKKQISVLSVEAVVNHQRNQKIQVKDILSLTREIARLLQAGLPLYEAISALEEKYKGVSHHPLLLGICDKLRSGQSLSTVLSAYPESFDLLYVSMVANAEKTGRLAEALLELAHLLDRQIKIKKQIVSALLYPSLLAGFCLVILCSLLFFVVPSLQDLFEGRQLHPLTEIVFTCSSFAICYKYYLLTACIGFVGLCISLWYSKAGRLKILSVILKAPFVKTFMAKVALVRFCRASATLLDGGLPVMTVLRQARSVVKHPELEKIICNAEEKISQGQPLHVCFQNNALIPPLVPRMIAIAQQGGKLAMMMGHIAEIYEEELETYLVRFTALAQPILLLILGALVGFVLLAVLLPLTDVSSFVN